MKSLREMTAAELPHAVVRACRNLDAHTIAQIEADPLPSIDDGPQIGHAKEAIRLNRRLNQEGRTAPTYPLLERGALTALRSKILEEGARVPPSTDLLYLVGQTQENQSSVLDVVRRFPTAKFGLIGHDETSHCGFPGFTAWKKELMVRGVDEERIVGITGSFVEMGGAKIVHTLSEMQALVRYTKRHGIRRVTLVAPEWHLLRSFMSVVLALREYPELSVYPMLGEPLPWEERSVHSQGTLTGRRLDFNFDETVRLYEYHAQGNLPSAEEALKYLDGRA